MNTKCTGLIVVFAGIMNLLASMALLLVLRQGTIASGTSISARMIYVTSHEVIWVIGWSSCLAGTLSLYIIA